MDEEPYKVIKQPIPDNPVFEVQKEDGTGRIKPLHRNQLLPCLPVLELHEVEEASRKESDQRTLGIPVTELTSEGSLNSSISSSDDDRDRHEEPETSPCPYSQRKTTVGLPRRPQRIRQTPGWIQSCNWVM